MNYCLRIEDLGKLMVVLGERISAEGVPRCDQEVCDEAAFGIFLDGSLLCERHAQLETEEMAAADMRG